VTVEPTPADDPVHDEPTDRAPLQGLAGSVALFFAAAVFVLDVVDRTHALPFMPMSWYTNRVLWYLLAFASLLGGVFLLRAAGREATADSSTARRDQPPVFASLVFYTRQGCHLCDEALNVLKRFQQFLPSIRIVDIDSDPSLVEQFNTCVPVVEIDGKVRFRGQVNSVLMQRMIDVELEKGGRRKAESG
jgi:glutaredoxin